MKYNGKKNISYEQALFVLNNGILGEKFNKIKKNNFSHNGGLYLGAPGKEIYFSLYNVSEKEMTDIAFRLAKTFPSSPPGNHVKWAACIRYVQGCFEKQGCLRSKKDKKRMINEKLDWGLSFRFMEMLKKEFEKNDTKYGLVIWHEMTAHRYGDLAIVNPDESEKYLNEMENNYIESQKIGIKIKSWKHCFTPFYWAGHYFHELGIKSKSIEYHKKNLEMMNKYCPDARPGYREKAQLSIKQLKKNMGGQFNSWFILFKEKIRNKCLRKAL